MPKRIDTKAVLDDMNATIRGEGKPSAETLLAWWKALAQEITEHGADRKRLEQWEAEAQDKARPQVRPMTVLENAYMDLKGKLAAAEAHIEALEIKAATWLALASPIWVGDESEGHFVCLACNQAGADDGGCKTIQHLPDCEYAAALAAEKKP